MLLDDEQGTPPEYENEQLISVRNVGSGKFLNSNHGKTHKGADSFFPVLTDKPDNTVYGLHFREKNGVK